MRRTLFWVFVALQALVPVAIAGVREVDVAGAEHVLLPAEPADPRDPFRGQYVAVRYRIGDLAPPRLSDGTTVYVPLYRGGETWTGTFATTTEPDRGPFIRGRVYEGRIEFGIEQLYVPEEEAHRYDQALVEGRVYADVALGHHGRATLRRLVIR
jgi:uncharacterized membrane-anchored protein